MGEGKMCARCGSVWFHDAAKCPECNPRPGDVSSDEIDNLAAPVGEVLGERNPTTIRTLRQIHEDCKTQHAPCTCCSVPICEYCAQIAPCPDYVDAVAALAILDNADTLPWCDDGSIHPIVRLVPDPDPGVGAEHAPKEHP